MSRTRREPLTRERVLAAAVALADAHGPEAVTMRRVGDELGREAMTLYHHVRDKKALVAGMVDVVIGEVVEALPAEPSPDWREDVRQGCLAARRVMLRHPWAPRVIAAQTSSPEAAYALFEWLVGRLLRAGFRHDLAHRAIHALGSMAFGFSQELFEPAPGEDEPLVTAELLDRMRQVTPYLAELAAVVAHDSQGSLSMCDTRAEFEFTLSLVLDGLERARLAEG